MSNQDILIKLEERDTEVSNEELPLNEEMRSLNGKRCKEYLVNWNEKESTFPVDQIQRYIRLAEWTINDFSPEILMLFARILPKWFIPVYTKMQEFMSNTRNELDSLVFTYAKMMGKPMTLPREKAFCYYEYLICEFNGKE